MRGSIFYGGGLAAHGVNLILFGLFFFFAWVLIMGVVGEVLMDFVVPVMYLRRIPVMAAWSVVIERLLK